MPEKVDDADDDILEGHQTNNNIPVTIDSNLDDNKFGSDVSCITSSGLYEGDERPFDTSCSNSRTAVQGLTSATMSGPTFKDQARSVVELLEPSIADVDNLRGEIVEDELAIMNDDGNNNNIEHLQVPSVRAQTIIPMAEAFVIANEGDDSHSSLADPHIVHIDEGTCSTATVPQATVTGSTTTNETEPTTTSTLDNNVGTDGTSEGLPNTRKDTSREEVESEMRKMTAEAVVNERKFWVRIIITAVVLNTLLVAGVVVGAFCLTGNCSSPNVHGTTSATANVGGVGTPGTLHPVTPPVMADSNSSVSPTYDGAFNRTQNPNDQNETNKQTESTTNPNVDISTIAEGTDSTSAPGGTNLTVSPNIGLTHIPFDMSSSSPSVAISTLSPQQNADDDSFVAFTTSAPNSSIGTSETITGIPFTIAPSVVPFASSSSPGQNISTGSDDTDSSVGSNSGIWILIAVAVVVEIMIMSGLIFCYRRWKQGKALQQKLQKDLDGADSSPA